MSRLPCLVAILLFASACGDDGSEEGRSSATPPPRAAGPEARPAREHASEEASAAEGRAADVDRPPSAAEGAARPAHGAAPEAAAGTAVADAPGEPLGCELAGPVPIRLWPGEGAVTIAEGGAGALVAGYARQPDGKEQLRLGEIGMATGFRALGALPVEPPYARSRSAPPALWTDDEGRYAVAFIDGSGAVKLATGRGPGTPRLLADVGERADARFAPVLARFGERFGVGYAAVESEERSMRVAWVRVAADTGHVVDRASLAPEGLTATSPGFLHGVEEPVLTYVDGRISFSPVYRQRLSGEGSPMGEPEVIQVLSHLAEPTRVAVAQVGDLVHVGYVAIGDHSATAVEWVTDATRSPDPVSVVPPVGYGRLSMDLRSLGGHVLFVSSAPLGRPSSAPREIQLRSAGPGGLGPVLHVGDAAGHGHQPRAVVREGGKVWVVFDSPQGTFFFRARCGAADEADE